MQDVERMLPGFATLLLTPALIIQLLWECWENPVQYSRPTTSAGACCWWCPVAVSSDLPSVMLSSALMLTCRHVINAFVFCCQVLMLTLWPVFMYCCSSADADVWACLHALLLSADFDLQECPQISWAYCHSARPRARLWPWSSPYSLASSRPSL